HPSSRSPKPQRQKRGHFMPLADQLTDYVHAAFTGLWVQTFEPDEAEREIVQLACDQKWKIATWDIANGLRLPANQNAAETAAGDPQAVLRSLPSLSQQGWHRAARPAQL